MIESRSTASAARLVERAGSWRLPRAFAGPPTATVRLARATDQLDVLIELFDATVAADTVSVTGANPAVRFTFGSQHVAERNIGTAVPVAATTSAARQAAGPSVVVVPISGSFPFTLDGLLGLADSAAGVVGTTTPGAPDGSVSALELPTSLMLSPVAGTRMRGPIAPLTVADVTEVWTAKLEHPTVGTAVDLFAVQNLSATDLVTPRIPSAANRDSIVTNSTTIAPLRSSRLWLTSGGAFARIRGDWPGASLTQYRHDIVSGRDLSAHTLTTGYLAPFGHRASIAVTAQRRFASDSAGGQVSLMHLTRHLNLLEPVVSTPRPFERDSGRGLPFVSIEAAVDESELITQAAVLGTNGSAITGVDDLKLLSNGTDLMVAYTAVDRAGNVVTFSLPATFIADAVAYQTGANQAPRRLIAVSNTQARRARREVVLNGAPVAFADPVAPGNAATTKATQSVLFEYREPITGTTATQLAAALSPAVFVAMKSAQVVDDTVSALGGQAGATIGVTHHPRWLGSGNGSGNFDLSYLKLDTPSVSTVAGGTPAAGVAALELKGEVLNQSSGIGLDLPLPTTPWDPAAALGAAAKLLGSISLADIINAVPFNLAVPGIDIPYTTVTVDGNTITVEFNFCPPLKSAPSLGFLTNPNTRCCVMITTVASVDGSTDPSVRTEIAVENFIFQVPAAVPAIAIDFASLQAVIETGRPFALTPDIQGWSFSGVLSFLEPLIDALSSFGADLDIDVDSSAIDLDVSISPPAINLGIARIENFTIGLHLAIPLDGGPFGVGIAIGKKSSPLDINVAMFGATFWLDLDMKFGDVPNLVSQIGVGVSIYWEAFDVDIIIAHANITLRLSADWSFNNGEVVFVGAFSVVGEISLLGLVTASTGVVASLTYSSASENLVLRATVIYDIDSIFGSITHGEVPLATQTFELGNGAGNGLRAPAHGLRQAPIAAPAATPIGTSAFANHYSEPQWLEYCDAFR